MNLEDATTIIKAFEEHHIYAFINTDFKYSGGSHVAVYTRASNMMFGYIFRHCDFDVAALEGINQVQACGNNIYF